MSAASATPGSGSAASGLLADLASLSGAVQSGGWASGGLSTGGDLSQLAASDSPLSALSAAGFDYVRPMVSFLEEPLTQLAGDPGSVSATAQNAQSTGSDLSALADSYRSARTNQTSNWSGTAADSYRDTGANLADGIAALGQAASTVGTAISNAGGAVAATAQGVRQDISDAVGQMLPVLNLARAQIPATHGASMVQAIPQCVQIAESYAQRIAARVQSLLASGQNLKGFLDEVVRVVDAVKQALAPTTSGGGSEPKPQNTQQQPGPDTTQPGQTGTGSAGGQQTTQQSSSTATGTSNQMASSPTLSDQASSDQSSSSGSDGSTSGLVSSASAGTGLNSDTSASTSPSNYSPASPSQSVTPQSVDTAFVPGSLTSKLGGGNRSGAESRSNQPGLTSGLANENGSSTGTTGTSAASSDGSSRNGMVGSGMGARSGQGQEDKEHRSPAWLQGDTGLFDPDDPATPSVIDTIPDDDYNVEPDSRPKPVEQVPEPVEEQGAPEPEPMTAEVLRKAAERKDAPPRLLRAADAVREGKFSWEEAAGFQSPHPLAQSLFTPKARETLWPMLREVAKQIGTESCKPQASARQAGIPTSDAATRI
jgi:uncharacterized protein YukE